MSAAASDPSHTVYNSEGESLGEAPNVSGTAPKTRRQLKKARQSRTENILSALLKLVRQKLAETNVEKEALWTTVHNTQSVLECIVCSYVLKNPMIIRECGHTTCLSCMTSWFTRAYNEAQEDTDDMVAPLIPPIHPVQVDDLQLDPEIADAIQDADDLLRPEYTCPLCREPVLRAPVKNYALDAVIAQAFPEEIEEPANGATKDADENLLRLFFRHERGL